MYKSILLKRAKSDIRSAAFWYEDRQTGLGKKFTSHIKEKVSFIKQNPKACIIRYKNVRTAVLDTFPFMIHYIIDEQRKSIIILAVLHTSRNPGSWEKR